MRHSLRPILPFLSLLVSLWMVLHVLGCGGGGGGSNPGGGGGNPTQTRVILNVSWGDRSRNVNAPSSALSAVVTIPGANTGNTNFTWTFNRGSAANNVSTRYVSPTAIDVGTWDLDVKLYSQPDGGGVVVGTTGARVTLDKDGNGIPQLNVTGVVQSITVPTPQNVAVGQKKDFVFTAKDGNGAIVPVTQGSATWAVTAGSSTLRFVNGQAEGLVLGTATITATVDGKTSPAVDVFCSPDTGTLQVTVNDVFGAGLQGATITVKQNGVQVGQGTTTNGALTLNTLPFGTVDVLASKTGFKPAQKTVDIPRFSPVSTQFSLPAEGAPNVTNIAAHVINVTGATATIEVDVVVSDADGIFVPGLGASDFTVDNVTAGNTSYAFAGLGVTLNNVQANGPYSAFITLDQSGSVSQSDPTNARLQAAKSFFSALGPGDNAAMGYFPDKDNSPFLKTFPQLGFVTNGPLYYPAIDSLAGLKYVSSPLYAATIQATDYTVQNGGNTNKAVILFTDGVPTGDTGTLQQAIDNAKSKGVKIFTIGLGSGTDAAALALLSQSTGGSAIQVTDARQLISFYKTLGALLEGSGQFYRTRWMVTKSSGTFVPRETFSTFLHVTAAGSPLSVPFFVEIP